MFSPYDSSNEYDMNIPYVVPGAAPLQFLWDLGKFLLQVFALGERSGYCCEELWCFYEQHTSEKKQNDKSHDPGACYGDASVKQVLLIWQYGATAAFHHNE